jgi:hypothetical protein
MQGSKPVALRRDRSEVLLDPDGRRHHPPGRMPTSEEELAKWASFPNVYDNVLKLITEVRHSGRTHLVSDYGKS